MSLKLINVRLGFANNSSSSHSMILLEDPSAVRDEPVSDDGCYGWESFTLVDRTAKEDYLASAIHASLVSQLGPVGAARVMEELLGRAPVIGSVDHQSVLEVPTTQGGSINLEFVQDLLAWVRSPAVAVLGGNDNDGSHPLRESAPDESVLDMRYWGGARAHKNPDTGVWTIFNGQRGARVKLTLVPNALPQDTLLQSKRPDLVDVKITDYCPYGCTYCYQGSTPQGQHASLAAIAQIAQALGEQGVFEAALGGGEATLHPHFLQVLDLFRENGITPNVTTRNLTWLRSPKVEQLQARVGSVAVSVDNLEKAEEAIGLIKAAGLQYTASLQVVVGTLPEADMKKLFALAWADQLQVTLLGYKDSGLGEAWREASEHDALIARTTQCWADWVVETRPAGAKPWQKLRLSIDTTLAAASAALLQRHEVSALLYHTKEGQSSMYIDAVRNVQAPSSYADHDREVAFDPGRWLGVFEEQARSRDRKISARLR